MILEIKTYPDSVLKKKCQEVEKIDEGIKKLIRDMFETMYANGGVGLSASQVGILKQIAVVDAGKGPQVFINPKILKKEGRAFSEEGCLSIPGVFLKIKRAKQIEVEALDQDGKKFKVAAEGLLSFCLQQEIDHLNGVLIINRANPLQRLKIKKYLKKL